MPFFPKVGGFTISKINATFISTNRRRRFADSFKNNKKQRGSDHLGNVRVSFTRNGNSPEVLDTNDYYPFGMNFLNSDLVSYLAQPWSKYKYNGKELQESGMYDYGARMYMPDIGRWGVVDPLAEVQPNKTPYHFVSNNPINRVDPTGMLDNPIYDEDGNFLGTDDKGLQGKAIVMNKDNFTQGMSHEDALSHSLGAKGLSSSEAQSSLLSHYSGLKNRPDYDGRITLNEANDWYRNGNGEPLFADLGQLNLSSITPNQFENKDITYFNLLFRGNRKDGLVYGTIGLTNLGNNEVKGYFDDYDFDIRPWNSPGNVIRNIETKIGDWKAGNGTGYRIHFYGKGRISPNREVFTPDNPGLLKPGEIKW